MIVTQEMRNSDNIISIRAAEQTNNIKEKVLLVTSFIKTMRNNMQQYVALNEDESYLHHGIELIRDYPEYNIAAIDESRPEQQYTFFGSFSSMHKIADLDSDKKLEISASFYLSSTFLSAFGSIPDLKWVYYLSNNGFSYTVPHFPINQHYLKEQTYQKEYWVKAIPDNNPEKRLVMSSLYQDEAGKGYVTTFSEPVYVSGKFRGIVALDVSMDSFNNVLATNSIIGDSFLVDENNLIFASDATENQGKELNLPDFNTTLNTKYQGMDGYDYIKNEVLPNELVFVYRIKRTEQYQIILNRSIRELILLFSSLVMAYMIYYFRILIFRVGTLANTDPLTQLLNRRAMENAVIPLVNLNSRYDQEMCFLLADIDHFKQVNDTYGHTVGDDVLVSITEVLNSCLRSSDLVSRHGGEEFLIVLPQTDLESGILLADRIRTSIEKLRTGEHQVAVTTSIGCVEIRKDEDYDSAISRADKMLYKAKTNGRNRTEIDKQD